MRVDKRQTWNMREKLIGDIRSEQNRKYFDYKKEKHPKHGGAVREAYGRKDFSSMFEDLNGSISLKKPKEQNQ